MYATCNGIAQLDAHHIKLICAPIAAITYSRTVSQVIQMRFTLNVLISRPLKHPRLEAFDFNSFAEIRARVTRARRISSLHSETNEELHKGKFLIRLMHTEYLSFSN